LVFASSARCTSAAMAASGWLMRAMVSSMLDPRWVTVSLTLSLS
jgi:hypothetical protein